MDAGPPDMRPAPHTRTTRALLSVLLACIAALLLFTALRSGLIPEHERPASEISVSTGQAPSTPREAGARERGPTSPPGAGLGLHVATELHDTAAAAAPAPTAGASEAAGAPRVVRPQRSERTYEARGGPLDAFEREGADMVVSPETAAYVRELARGLAASLVEMPSAADAQAAFCEHRGRYDMLARFERATIADSHLCGESGRQVTAVKIGYDAVVLARTRSYGAFALAPRDAFLALAAEVPDPIEPARLVENPYRLWGEIDAALPYEPIGVIGPELDTLLGRSFVELTLAASCDSFAPIAALAATDPGRHARLCGAVRDDGVYSVVPETQAAIEHLAVHPNVVGVLSYVFFELERELLDAAPLDGVEPEAESLETGTYAASRILYLYFDRDAARRGDSAAIRFVRFMRSGRGHLPPLRPPFEDEAQAGTLGRR